MSREGTQIRILTANTLFPQIELVKDAAHSPVSEEDSLFAKSLKVSMSCLYAGWHSFKAIPIHLLK